MRPWLIGGLTACVAMSALQCTTAPMGGELDLTAVPRKVIDDGEQATLSVTATDTTGKIGTGTVTFEAFHGQFGATSIVLDAYGTAKTTFACDKRIDPLCSGNIAVRATWNGVRRELPIEVAERCPGGILCGDECATIRTDWRNCGACGARCQTTETCSAGACVPCPGADCDGDGWSPALGDCCDQYDVCTKPLGVNPGALEAPGNLLDDNCNGLVDDLDTEDTASCDETLTALPTTAMDFARALGLCRTTTEFPPLQTKAWGVISAEILLADGAVGASLNQATIRPQFGVLPPHEGSRLAVFSTGAAADLSHTNPPLSVGAGNTTVDIGACDAGACIKDWFQGSRPPLKTSGRLPGSPNCAGSGSDQNEANDSVMLRLRIRAPTNASSFKVKTRFFSEEYPDFVCSAFNDQVVLLLDTPGATAYLRNPSDKNLMTYTSDAGTWPVGINLATGTPLFQSCTSMAASPSCWDTSVNPLSCGLGPGDLAGTQFAATSDGGCVQGGATRWLVTTGNVQPGEIFEIRAAVWNVSDHALQSLFLMDDFRWGVDAGEPGTGEE